jgi:arsenite-transporting ATPase
VSTSDDPLGVLGPVRHEGLRVRRSGSGYVLSLPLPLVDAREVGLKRRDTELLVSVGDHRRVLSLPAVLQRCVVRGARVREGTLRVTFEPDPDQWPVHVDAPGSDEGMQEVAHG